MAYKGFIKVKAAMVSETEFLKLDKLEELGIETSGMIIDEEVKWVDHWINADLVETVEVIEGYPDEFNVNFVSGRTITIKGNPFEGN